MKPWPKVSLGEVLSKSEETVSPRLDTEYSEITVRLWGKGVVERGDDKALIWWEPAGSYQGRERYHRLKDRCPKRGYGDSATEP